MKTSWAVARSLFVCTSIVATLLGLAFSARAEEDDAIGRKTHETGIISRSPTGKYSVQVVDESGKSARLVVRKRGKKIPIASFKISGRNVDARFVAGENLLASWGCGSPCEMGGLFDPRGRQLAVLSNPEVSPDGAFAASIDILDLETGDCDVTIFDLRTGKSVATYKQQSGLWKACKRRWEAGRLIFSPCDARKQPTQLPLTPNKPSARPRGRTSR